MTQASSLTRAQRAWIESDLKLRLEQAQARSDDHRGGMTSVDHAHDVLLEDADDAPQREDSRAVDQALTDRDRVVMNELATALRHVHDPDFGLCKDCSDQIAFDRLKVEPWAQRCVACQSAAERTSPMR